MFFVSSFKYTNKTKNTIRTRCVDTCGFTGWAGGTPPPLVLYSLQLLLAFRAVGNDKWVCYVCVCKIFSPLPLYGFLHM